MQPQSVICSNCKAALPIESYNLEEFVPCPSCEAPTRAFVFPALFRRVSVTSSERLSEEGQASCFYHPQKRAVVPCESCGRFLCALCDVDLNGQHLCPTCLETGRTKGKLKSLENTRTRYDRMALATAVLPMLLVWTSLLGAPIALYVAIRYWNAPCSILGPRKGAFITAIVLASLQIIAWVVAISYWIMK